MAPATRSAGPKKQQQQQQATVAADDVVVAVPVVPQDSSTTTTATATAVSASATPVALLSSASAANNKTNKRSMSSSATTPHHGSSDGGGFYSSKKAKNTGGALVSVAPGTASTGAAATATATTPVALLVDDTSSSPHEREIRQLVKVDLFDTNSKVVELALVKIADHCYIGSGDTSRTGREHSSIVYDSGGHLAIMKAMERFDNNPALLVEACRALCNMMFDNRDVIRSLVAIDGVDDVLKCMRSFPDNELLQEVCCSFLEVLSRVAPRDAATLLVNLNGLPLLMNAMRTFRENREIQLRSLDVIFTASRWSPESHGPLRAAGALSAIAIAIEMNDEQHFHTLAANTMKQLLDSSPSNNNINQEMK